LSGNSSVPPAPSSASTFSSERSAVNQTQGNVLRSPPVGTARTATSRRSTRHGQCHRPVCRSLNGTIPRSAVTSLRTTITPQKQRRAIRPERFCSSTPHSRHLKLRPTGPTASPKLSVQISQLVPEAGRELRKRERLNRCACLENTRGTKRPWVQIPPPRPIDTLTSGNAVKVSNFVDVELVRPSKTPRFCRSPTPRAGRGRPRVQPSPHQIPPL
jgi:hypothetical protein